MIFFLAGFGLLLHIFFWGVGLSLLITPRVWLRHAWLFAPACGLALQSAVVWAGASVGLPGTESYARWVEFLPVILLGAGAWRVGRKKWMSVAGTLRTYAGVWLAMAVTLNALLIPMSSASKTLTTMSLASCDAADYAAGARVLQEFSRDDRTGFIGQTETVTVGKVDTFFEYWLRLNHFTPSAVVALNNAVFGWSSYQTVSVMTAVLVALSLPLVFWLARAGLRLGAAASLTVACLYGASPVLWYAVYHVAMAQLIAALAVALLTWCAVALWRTGAGWRLGWRLSAMMAVAYWLLLGAYNFIIAVALVPAVAYAGGRALHQKRLGAFLRWAVLMVTPLLVCGLVFYGRVEGLWERVGLLQQNDFGWKIPPLYPEGWFGLVADEHLNPHGGWLRGALMGAVVAMLAVALVRLRRKSGEKVWMVVAFTVPVLVGYTYLIWRGEKLGTRASYDAYKLFAVFYPCFLGAAACWLHPGRNSPVGLRGAVAGVAALVLVFQAKADWAFSQRMKSPPLMVDRWLVQLQRIEGMKRFASFNILPVDEWSRLWANVFLLRKNQYFAEHTYEARRNTELRGDWDLLSGILTVRLPEDGDGVPDYVDLSRQRPGSGRSFAWQPVVTGESGPLPFILVNTRSRYFLRARIDAGWHGMENIPRAGTRWRWTTGDAAIRVMNPHDYPLRVAFRFNARSFTPRSLEIWQNGQRLRKAQIGPELKVVRVGDIEIPPGESVLELRSDQAATMVEGDPRPLGFAAYGIELRVLEEKNDATR
jgi:hypothetical protein